MTAATPDDLLRRVGACVETYGGQTSRLIGVENYSQSQDRRAVQLPGIRVGRQAMAGVAPIDDVEFGSALAQRLQALRDVYKIK